MGIFDAITNLLEVSSNHIPLELFVLLGSFIEEVIAPIPSPLVMVLAGSLAQAQEQPIVYLIVLSVFGSLGKTLGAFTLYFISDKLEDLVINKFGRFLRVSHKDIESIGKRFNNTWKDFVFLFVARTIPIMPSVPISVSAGIIKIDKKKFILATFLGTCVRDGIYLYLGYAGFENYKEISSGLENVESFGQIILLVALIALVVWSYYKRGKYLKTKNVDLKSS